MKVNNVPREAPCCWWGSIYTPPTPPIKTSRWSQYPNSQMPASETAKGWPIRLASRATARKLAIVVHWMHVRMLAGQTVGGSSLTGPSSVRLPSALVTLDRQAVAIQPTCQVPSMSRAQPGQIDQGTPVRPPWSPWSNRPWTKNKMNKIIKPSPHQMTYCGILITSLPKSLPLLIVCQS